MFHRTRGLIRRFSTANLEDIIITKSCSSRINHLKASSPTGVNALRLSVESGGCSGFQYSFKMEQEKPAANDKVFSRDGAEVIIDEDSFAFVKGATIDFQQELIRQAFVVMNNPLSESACGCGSSFAVKNFSANPALD